MSMIKCPACGGGGDSSNAFCANCGYPLAQPMQQPMQQPYAMGMLPPLKTRAAGGFVFLLLLNIATIVLSFLPLCNGMSMPGISKHLSEMKGIYALEDYFAEEGDFSFFLQASVRAW